MYDRPLPSDTHERLVAYFQSGAGIRSRSISTTVLAGRVDLPPLPLRLLADWEHEVHAQLGLEPGDVESLPLPRARLRWPDYRQCVQVASSWADSVGLPDELPSSPLALMACRGARYHFDAEHYGGAAFCNLFVSEDKGLDLHFPAIGRRIPLQRGTMVVFDTGQPHAVIDRQREGFAPGDFSPGRDCTLVFLTWELSLAGPAVARALATRFDIDPVTAGQVTQEEVWRNGARASVCPDSGRWR